MDESTRKVLDAYSDYFKKHPELGAMKDVLTPGELLLVVARGKPAELRDLAAEAALRIEQLPQPTAKAGFEDVSPKMVSLLYVGKACHVELKAQHKDEWVIIGQAKPPIRLEEQKDGSFKIDVGEKRKPLKAR